MIWATVSSWSCFCWLYRASLSSAAKNTINLTLGLTICWCPCVEPSLVLLEKDVCYVCFLDKTLLAFALLHFVLQGQTCLLFQVSLDFLLLHSNPLWWTGHLFLVLFLEGLVDIHRISKLQLLQHQWLGHRLELLWSTTPWIWSTIALWILVKPLHLGTMLSKWMRCTKNCNACSQHWSTERAQFFSTTKLNSILHNQCFKSWTNWAMKFCFIHHIHLTSCQQSITSSSISTTFCRENASTTRRMQKMLSNSSSNPEAWIFTL